MEMTRESALVVEYFAGFEAGDHGRILAILTPDVEWVIYGHQAIRGKAAFDAEIENPAFTGNPTFAIERLYQDGSTVVALGTGTAHTVSTGSFSFAFNDVFTIKDGLIARVDSYVVPLGQV